MVILCVRAVSGGETRQNAAGGGSDDLHGRRLVAVGQTLHLGDQVLLRVRGQVEPALPDQEGQVARGVVLQLRAFEQLGHDLALLVLPEAVHDPEQVLAGLPEEHGFRVQAQEDQQVGAVAGDVQCLRAVPLPQDHEVDPLGEAVDAGIQVFPVEDVVFRSCRKRRLIGSRRKRRGVGGKAAIGVCRAGQEAADLGGDVEEGGVSFSVGALRTGGVQRSGQVVGEIARGLPALPEPSVEQEQGGEAHFSCIIFQKIPDKTKNVTPLHGPPDLAGDVGDAFQQAQAGDPVPAGGLEIVAADVRHRPAAALRDPLIDGLQESPQGAARPDAVRPGPAAARADEEESPQGL